MHTSVCTDQRSKKHDKPLLNLMAKKYKVYHKRDKCIGCGFCPLYAECQWSMADDGKSRLVGTEGQNEALQVSEIDEKDLEANKMAADTCPVNVIGVEGHNDAGFQSVDPSQISPKIEAVVGIIEVGEKFLIGQKIKREKDVLSDLWHLPGGKLDKGESPEDALRREIKEESGLVVTHAAYLDMTVQRDGAVHVHWFYAKADGVLAPKSDLQNVALVNKAEVIDRCDQGAIELWSPKVKEFFDITS